MSRSVRLLWTATTVDAFGSWLLLMAVPLQVFTITGSVTSAGLTLAVEAAPAVLIGPWAGAVADRLPRTTVLVVANLAAAAGVGLLLGGLPLLYLGLVVEKVAMCFAQPALAAALTASARNPAELASANALTAVSTSVLRLAGPLVGTLLVAHGWFTAVVLVDLASYVAAAAIVSRLPAVPVGGPAGRDRALRAGLRRIARTPVLRGLLGVTWVYWTANAALTTLLIPFVTLRLDRGGEAVGWLVAGLGVGYLTGAALSRRVVLRYPIRTVLLVAYSIIGCCFLTAFTTTSLPVALAAITVSGVPGALTQVAVRQCWQTAAPNHETGRVAATFAASDGTAAVAGAGLAPAVVAVAGLALAPAAISVAVLLAAALAATLRDLSPSPDP
jgi:predicted MFS family arabinose efflux permease